MDRICQSPPFERSPKLQEFLRYVTARSLAGRENEITEQLIGHFVYGRRIDYDTAQDNTVRVNARHLRAKLAEYFEGAGAGEEWLLEIPKGGYVPVFRRRVIPAAGKAPPSGARWRMVAALFLLAFALSAGIQLWRAAADRPTDSPLWQLTLRNSGKLVVVIADTALVLYGAMELQRPELPDYLARRFEYPSWFPRGNPDAERFWTTLNNRLNTDLAAVESVKAISRAYPESVHLIEWKHPQQFQLRDYPEHSILFLGSSSSVPWATSFEKGLNFEQRGTGFDNLQPKPGEPARFEGTDRFGQRGVGFARISIQPKPGSHNLRVIHVASTSWLASEAGMRFLIDGASLGELDRSAGPGWRRQDSRTEFILETEALETAAGFLKLRALRHGQGRSGGLNTAKLPALWFNQACSDTAWSSVSVLRPKKATRDITPPFGPRFFR